MTATGQRMLVRLTVLIEKGEEVARSVTRLPSNYIGFDNPVSTDRFSEWQSQSLAYMTNLLGPDHSYLGSFKAGCKTSGISDTKHGIGVLRAIKSDLEDGFLDSLRDIIHADVFDDFLAMADHLLIDGGYKDASAVIAGSTLEEHIRKLCLKNNIETVMVRANGSLEPKKASTMNDALHKAAAYNQIEWRSVQGWLDIRNDAAHGNYDRYSGDQVRLMIDGIRGFITRNLA